MAVSNNRIANQGLWIGGGFGTMDDATPLLKGQVGQVVTVKAITYQLVQFKSTTTAIANGTPVMWSDFDDFVVSAKVADAKRNYIAGVALGTQTAGSYGWIQVAGPHSAIITDGTNTGVAGDVFFMGTADGTAKFTAAATAPICIPLAVATGSEAASAVAGTIIAPHNGW